MKKYSYIVLLFSVISIMTAHASLIEWSGIQNIRYESAGNGELTLPWEFDINGDGVLDFDFTLPPSMFIQPYNGAQFSSGPHFGGVLFDAHSDWEATGRMLTSNHEPVGYSLSETLYWDNISRGYLGTQVATEGNIYYGWLCMSVSVDSDVSANNYVVFHDWAYNSQPGVGIMAGVVPEPSTWALFLCGGIALLARLLARLQESNNVST